METKYISFGGKNYILDINKIIEFCLTSDNKLSRDHEVTEGYEKMDEDSDELTLTSRVIRENSGPSNPQNDMVTYDFIKLLLSILLGQDEKSDVSNNISFALAFNTMVAMEFLIEVK